MVSCLLILNDFQIKCIQFETKEMVRVLGFGLGFVLFCFFLGMRSGSGNGSKVNQRYAVSHGSGS